jgi:hypothetical protein
MVHGTWYMCDVLECSLLADSLLYDSINGGYCTSCDGVWVLESCVWVLEARAAVYLVYVQVATRLAYAVLALTDFGL